MHHGSRILHPCILLTPYRRAGIDSSRTPPLHSMGAPSAEPCAVVRARSTFRCGAAGQALHARPACPATLKAAVQALHASLAVVRNCFAFRGGPVVLPPSRAGRPLREIESIQTLHVYIQSLGVCRAAALVSTAKASVRVPPGPWFSWGRGDSKGAHGAKRGLPITAPRGAANPPWAARLVHGAHRSGPVRYASVRHQSSTKPSVRAGGFLS
jgi:hypothetical protein